MNCYVQAGLYLLGFLLLTVIALAILYWMVSLLQWAVKRHQEWLEAALPLGLLALILVFLYMGFLDSICHHKPIW